MTAQTTSLVVAAICGVTCLGFWLWLVAVPVARSFDRGLDRLAAVILSAYSLAVGIGIGTAVGLLVAYEWDRIAPA